MRFMPPCLGTRSGGGEVWEQKATGDQIKWNRSLSLQKTAIPLQGALDQWETAQGCFRLMLRIKIAMKNQLI